MRASSISTYGSIADASVFDKHLTGVAAIVAMAVTLADASVFDKRLTGVTGIEHL